MKGKFTSYAMAVVGGMTAGVLLWGGTLWAGCSDTTAAGVGGLGWLLTMLYLLFRVNDRLVPPGSRTSASAADHRVANFWNNAHTATASIPDAVVDTKSITASGAKRKTRKSSAKKTSSTRSVATAGPDAGVRELVLQSANSPRHLARITASLMHGLADKVASGSTADPYGELDRGLQRIDRLLEGTGASTQGFAYDNYGTVLRMREALIENHLNRGALPVKNFKAARWLYPCGESDMPFLFKKKEVVLFAADSVGTTETKMKTRYQAGSRGVTVRIAKGISCRVGDVKGKRISEEVDEFVGNGPVAITNSNLYYACGGKSRRVALDKIVSVSRSGSKLTWVKEAARPKPVTWSFKSTGDAMLAERVMSEGPDLE